jgi:hypothetical protein
MGTKKEAFNDASFLFIYFCFTGIAAVLVDWYNFLLINVWAVKNNPPTTQ